MRVIAGVAGGIPLLTPRHGQVRPTMDQVRGAIFSSLAELVPEARVLDLFAGTGAFGIEALSRGARSVTFVEQDRAAADGIRRNLEKTRLMSAAASIVSRDVFTFLSHRERLEAAEGFDLIFADPPYTTRDQPIAYAQQLTLSISLQNTLEQDGLLILEKSPRDQIVIDPLRWDLTRQKRYGSTEILFLRKVGAAQGSLPDPA